MERWRVERLARKADQEKKAREKSEQEKEVLLGYVPDIDQISEDIDSEHEVVDNNDDDSDWVDIVEDKIVSEYNTLKLKNFSRECDRYKTSNREGAKLANALLRDLGLVTKNNSAIMSPHKVQGIQGAA